MQRDLTISETAERLGTSRASVRALIAAGHLDAYRLPIGRQDLRVKPESLDRLRDTNAVRTSARPRRTFQKQVKDYIDG